MQILGFLPPRKSSYTPLGPKIALFARTHRDLHDAKNRKLITLRIRVLHRHQVWVPRIVYKKYLQKVCNSFSCNNNTRADGVAADAYADSGGRC